MGSRLITFVIERLVGPSLMSGDFWVIGKSNTKATEQSRLLQTGAGRLTFCASAAFLGDKKSPIPVKWLLAKW